MQLLITGEKGNQTCVFNALGAAEPLGEAYPWLTPTDPIHIGRKSQNNLLIPRKITCGKKPEKTLTSGIPHGMQCMWVRFIICLSGSRLRQSRDSSQWDKCSSDLNLGRIL
ncbi:hypothetical protein TNCV_1585641 [Trichonephila clavipes]|nr:hypothetical protein TNCV_1585641 [Trichonephila clavipes]